MRRRQQVVAQRQRAKLHLLGAHAFSMHMSGREPQQLLRAPAVVVSANARTSRLYLSPAHTRDAPLTGVTGLPVLAERRIKVTVLQASMQQMRVLRRLGSVTSRRAIRLLAPPSPPSLLKVELSLNQLLLPAAGCARPPRPQLPTHLSGVLV